ncbi:MAG: STAS/SEC14 domain-containing protein [Planctomycetota bacterium]
MVGFKFCGKLHDEDCKQFVPQMETISTAEGKVRLFIQLEDFHGWDLYATLDDIKFSLKHISRILYNWGSVREENAE